MVGIIDFLLGVSKPSVNSGIGSLLDFIKTSEIVRSSVGTGGWDEAALRNNGHTVHVTWGSGTKSLVNIKFDGDDFPVSEEDGKMLVRATLSRLSGVMAAKVKAVDSWGRP